MSKNLRRYRMYVHPHAPNENPHQFTQYSLCRIVWPSTDFYDLRTFSADLVQILKFIRHIIKMKNVFRFQITSDIGNFNQFQYLKSTVH